MKIKKRNLSNLIKKNESNTKISEIEKNITTDHDHCIYITTQEFDKLLSETFTERLKQANVSSKSDNGNLVKKTDFDNKVKDVTSDIN